MDNNEFKTIFSEFASAAGFEFARGGWFKNSSECVVVLDLQKSNFGNYFDLNIKVFVQGLFGKSYGREKEMVKKLAGDVFWRPPDKHNRALDLTNALTPEARREMLNELFDTFVLPTTSNALTISGILDLKEKGLVYLLPAVESGLASMSDPQSLRKERH